MALLTREAPPAHLLFKIESFSLLNQCGIDKYETRDFDAGNYKWRLVIYPNRHGIEKAGGKYVFVHLAISGTDSLPKKWEVNVVFSIFILNQISGHYLHTPGKTSRFFALKTEWGIPKFISKKELALPSNGYIVDDSCVFGAEVSVIDPVPECLSLKAAILPYKRSFTISNFSTLKNIWKIKIYPSGYGNEAGRSMSIYLVYVPSNNKNTKVKADYSIFLKNQLESIKDHKLTLSHWFEEVSDDWGLPSFISIAQLNGPNGGFIIKDTCLLEIEISVRAEAK